MWQVISDLLVKDPHRRPTAARAAAQLRELKASAEELPGRAAGPKPPVLLGSAAAGVVAALTGRHEDVTDLSPGPSTDPDPTQDTLFRTTPTATGSEPVPHDAETLLGRGVGPVVTPPGVPVPGRRSDRASRRPAPRSRQVSRKVMIVAGATAVALCRRWGHRSLPLGQRPGSGPGHRSDRLALADRPGVGVPLGYGLDLEVGVPHHEYGEQHQPHRHHDGAAGQPGRTAPGGRDAAGRRGHDRRRRGPLDHQRVDPVEGRLQSITVLYLGGSRVVAPIEGVRGPYHTVVNGLDTGQAYTFTARVCNTVGDCTDSRPVTYTPYDVPTLRAPTMSVLGVSATASWRALDLNGNPRTWTCRLTVTSTPQDPNAPRGKAIPITAGQITWPAQPRTTYQATETCTDGTFSMTQVSASVITL